jgi:polyphosphate kinase
MAKTSNSNTTKTNRSKTITTKRRGSGYKARGKSTTAGGINLLQVLKPYAAFAKVGTLSEAEFTRAMADPQVMAIAQGLDRVIFWNVRYGPPVQALGAANQQGIPGMWGQPALTVSGQQLQQPQHA